MSNSQLGYNYELYRNNIPTGNIKAGTNNPLNFTGIALAGTYTIYAYYAGSPLCAEQMNGNAIITVSTGASADVTGLATATPVCEGEAVEIEILLVGVPPFNFTVNESYSGRTWNVSNLDVPSGTTYTYSINTVPVWVDQGNPAPGVANFTYTVTNLTDDSGCGTGSTSGSATVDIFKIPQTGPQYHISNDFAN